MTVNQTPKRGAAMANLRADLARYREDVWLKRFWWLTERSVWAVVAFRFSQRALEIRNRRVRNIVALLMSLISTAAEVATNIKLSATTQIGPGMRIYFGSGITISPFAVIGDRVVLRHGVTIGAAERGGSDFPVVGHDVDFGAYAQVFGGVKIGDGARIGSMSVVIKDVPSGATVFGVPARIVKA